MLRTRFSKKPIPNKLTEKKDVDFKVNGTHVQVQVEQISVKIGLCFLLEISSGIFGGLWCLVPSLGIKPRPRDVASATVWAATTAAKVRRGDSAAAPHTVKLARVPPWIEEATTKVKIWVRDFLRSSQFGHDKYGALRIIQIQSSSNLDLGRPA